MNIYATIALLVGAVFSALLLPHLVGLYSVELLNIFLVNIILVASYRLIVKTGDWGLAHIVMMGVGAYSAALIARETGVGVFITIPLAAIITGFIGFLVSATISRTVGFGYFIASFALAELIRLSWVKFEHPFGGVRGLANVPIGNIFGYSLFDPIVYYYLSLTVVIICILIMFQIDRSRIGRVYKSLYQNRDLANSVGINVNLHRITVFVIGSAFAGVAGALLVHRLGATDPKNFDIITMIYLVIWVVVGGTTTFWGPFIGLFSMTLIFEWTRPLLEWRPVIFGSILILFLIYLPDGLEGIIHKLVSLLKRRKSNDV